MNAVLNAQAEAIKRSAERKLAQAVDAPGAAGGVKPRQLDLRSLSPLSAPPRFWFLQGWLGSGTTLFPGLGGIGKSSVVQHAATNAALARPYFAEAERPITSLLWNCEDDHDEMWRREEMICEHEQIEMADLADRLHLVSRYGCENALMGEFQRQLGPTSLMEELRQQVNDLGIDVLWLDNAAHVFVGDHDNRTQVTQFINALNGLVVGRPFAVVICAHVSRAQGSEYSGSVAWENAARMRWYLGTKLPDERPDDDGDSSAGDTRFLAKRKSNYSARDYVRMTMRNGLLVPDAPSGHVAGVVAQIAAEKAEEAVLAGFHSLRAMGLVPTDAKNSPDYLPRQMLDKGLGCGHGKHELAKAMNRLMTAGVFSRGVAGMYGNRNPKQGLVLQSKE